MTAVAAGTGEVQKRPEGWVLPNETLPAEVVVRPCHPREYIFAKLLVVPCSPVYPMDP